MTEFSKGGHEEDVLVPVRGKFAKVVLHFQSQLLATPFVEAFQASGHSNKITLAIHNNRFILGN